MPEISIMEKTARLILESSTKRGAALIAIANWYVLKTPAERINFVAALYCAAMDVEGLTPEQSTKDRIELIATELVIAQMREGMAAAEAAKKAATPEPGQQPPAPEPASKRTCNRHFDCEAAEKVWLEAHSEAGRYIPPSFHCHDDDECEHCFGK